MGTGTVEMIRQCADAGLPEPEFVIADGFVTTVRRPAAERPEPGRVTTRDGENAGRNRAGVQVARPGVQVGVQVGGPSWRIGECGPGTDGSRFERDQWSRKTTGTPGNPRR